MRRVLFRIVVSVVVLGLGLVVLDRTFLLVVTAADGASSEAPTFPPCNGRGLAEGFTYHFRDPRRGETVLFHASGRIGGVIRPDQKARDLAVMKRVVGVPGDQVVARGGSVYVNGLKFDDIQTESFPKVDLGSNQYFVLGDNRSFSQDSREFGPVPRAAIFGRAFLVFWPLRDFGPLEPRHAGAPPGPGLCD